MKHLLLLLKNPAIRYRLYVVHIFETWLSCIISPIICLIFQSASIKNELVQACVALDFICVIFWSLEYEAIQALYDSMLKERGSDKTGTAWRLLKNSFELLQKSSVVSLAIFSPLNAQGDVLYILMIWRLSRFLEIFPLLEQIRLIVPEDARIRDSLARILYFLIHVLVYMSFTGCLWFYLSCKSPLQTLWITGNQSSQHECKAYSSWIQRDNIIDLNNGLSRYLRSVYFVSQVFTTVGYGDIYPENDEEIIFCLFLIVNSAIYVNYFVASMGSYVGSIDIAGRRYKDDMNQIKGFIAESHCLTNNFKSNLLNYFAYVFAKQNGIKQLDFETMDSNMPFSMKIKIMDSFRQYLTKVPFFQRADRLLVNLCLYSLDYRIYKPGSVLISKGERTRELAILFSGKLEVCIPNNARGSVCVHDLGDSHDASQGSETDENNFTFGNASPSSGQWKIRNENVISTSSLSNFRIDHVGAYEFLFNCLSQFTVLATEYSEVFVLSSDKFRAALERYEQLKAMEGIEADLVVTLTTAVSATSDSYLLFLENIHKLLREHNSETLLKSSLETQQHLSNIAVDIQKVAKGSKWMLHPSHRFHLIWNLLLLFGLLYYAIVIPTRVAAGLYRGLNAEYEGEIRLSMSRLVYSLTVDYIVDLMLTIDFVLRSSFFSYYAFDENNLKMLISDRPKIFQKFRTENQKRFLVAALLLLPVDLFATGFGYLLLFRLYRLLSVYLIPLYLQVLVFTELDANPTRNLHKL